MYAYDNDPYEKLRSIQYSHKNRVNIELSGVKLRPLEEKNRERSER